MTKVEKAMIFHYTKTPTNHTTLPSGTFSENQPDWTQYVYRLRGDLEKLHPTERHIYLVDHLNAAALEVIAGEIDWDEYHEFFNDVTPLPLTNELSLDARHLR